MFAIRLITKEEKPKEFYLFESKGKDSGLHWTQHCDDAQFHHSKDNAVAQFTWAVNNQYECDSYLFKETQKFVPKGVKFEIELCEIKFGSLRTAVF